MEHCRSLILCDWWILAPPHVAQLQREVNSTWQGVRRQSRSHYQVAFFPQLTGELQRMPNLWLALTHILGTMFSKKTDKPFILPSHPPNYALREHKLPTYCSLDISQVQVFFFVEGKKEIEKMKHSGKSWLCNGRLSSALDRDLTLEKNSPPSGVILSFSEPVVRQLSSEEFNYSYPNIYIYFFCRSDKKFDSGSGRFLPNSLTRAMNCILRMWISNV